MSLTTLRVIWSLGPENVQAVLATQNYVMSGNLDYDKVIIAQLYYNAGRLDVNDMPIVAHPNFVEIMSRCSDRPLDTCLSEVITSSNEQLINHFKRLSELYSITPGKVDEYRANTFKRVVDVLKNLKFKVVSSIQLEGLPGIGKSTLQEVDEFLTTDTSKRLIELENKYAEVTAVTSLFTQVHGIGPVKAVELYNQGYRTVEQLVGAPLTEAQQIGVKYFYHFKERIPHSEIDEYVSLMEKVLSKDNGNDWAIAGSYRRGLPTSGDIDLIILNKTGTETTYSVLSKLQPIIADVIAQGDRKVMLVSTLGPGRIYRRMDIRVFSPEEWAYGLLYNTGDASFNKAIRVYANSLGYTLSEYELSPLDPSATVTIPPVSTEQDIFDLLGLKYLEPWERINIITLAR